MTDPSIKTLPRTEAEEVPAKTVFSELRRMLTLYWVSRDRKRLLMLAAGLFIVIAATAHMQVRLNSWNQPVYDALTRKDVPKFIAQLRVCAVLATILLTLNVAQV